MFKWDDRMLNPYLSEQEMKEAVEKDNKLDLVAVAATACCSSSSRPTEGGVIHFLRRPVAVFCCLLPSLCAVFKVSTCLFKA